jgi:hypothetical protein
MGCLFRRLAGRIASIERQLFGRGVVPLVFNPTPPARSVAVEKPDRIDGPTDPY